jgi:hypothetical protein
MTMVVVMVVVMVVRRAGSLRVRVVQVRVVQLHASKGKGRQPVCSRLVAMGCVRGSRGWLRAGGCRRHCQLPTSRRRVLSGLGRSYL